MPSSSFASRPEKAVETEQASEYGDSAARPNATSLRARSEHVQGNSDPARSLGERPHPADQARLNENFPPVRGHCSRVL